MTTQPVAPGGTRRVGKTRNPWGVWLLGLVTFGIYYYYWYFKVNSEVRDYDPSIKVEPGVALVAVLLGWVILVPPFVSTYKTGARIAQAQAAAGSPEKCSAGIGLLLFLVGFANVYYQSQLNKVWDMHGNPPEGTPV